MVVHCKRQEFDVYIGRPSKWGNPFVIGKDGSRDEVIAKYEAWLISQPALIANLPELAGKTLGCWCAPFACHGDVLSRLANQPKPDVLQPIPLAQKPNEQSIASAYESVERSEFASRDDA